MPDITIRRAEEKDIDKIIELLLQIHELHANIRPDIFAKGKSKFNREELVEIMKDELTPIYVAVDSEDSVLGHAFLEIKERNDESHVAMKELHLEDLCVDEKARGLGVGTALFEFVKKKGHELGCYELTLSVWAGNDSARRFYDRVGLKEKFTMLEYIL